MNKLSEESGFEEEEGGAASSAESAMCGVYRLRMCGHKLHLPCLKMYIKNSSQVRKGGKIGGKGWDVLLTLALSWCSCVLLCV